MGYFVEKLEKKIDFQSEFSKTKIEGLPCLLTMQKEGKSVNSNLGSNVSGYQQTTDLGPDGKPSVEGQQEVNTQGSQRKLNLDLEGMEPGEIISSPVKKLSPTQPILSKKRNAIGKKKDGGSQAFEETLGPAKGFLEMDRNERKGPHASPDEGLEPGEITSSSVKQSSATQPLPLKNLKEPPCKKPKLVFGNAALRNCSNCKHTKMTMKHELALMRRSAAQERLAFEKKIKLLEKQNKENVNFAQTMCMDFKAERDELKKENLKMLLKFKKLQNVLMN